MESLVRFSIYRVILPVIVGGGLIEILFRIYYKNPYFTNFYITSLLKANLLFITIFLFWALGLIFMYSSEVIFLFFFEFNIFNRGNYIEKLSPLEGRRLSFEDFSLVSQEILDFSEVNYVLSVFLMSFHLLLLIYVFMIVSINYWIIPFSIIIFLEFLFLFLTKKGKVIKINAKLIGKIYFYFVALLEIYGLLCFLFKKELLIFLVDSLQFLSLSLAIRFRIFANKLLFYNRNRTKLNEKHF